jgi:hypothetical protein
MNQEYESKNDFAVTSPGKLEPDDGEKVDGVETVVPAALTTANSIHRSVAPFYQKAELLC